MKVVVGILPGIEPGLPARRIWRRQGRTPWKTRMQGHQTVTSATFVVSLPKMSITFTAILYFPFFG